MHRVGPLGAGTQAIALDGLEQHHAGLAAHFGGLAEGGVDLAVVLAAALDGANFLIGEGLHQFAQFRRVLHPVLAHRIAGGDGVHLVVAVHRLLHARLQDAVVVAGQNRIPAAAPDDLDDVPIRAPEGALQFLDDLAVAAHRPVEALQIAVDHQHQVVELLPARDVDGAEHLRLIGLAVADEGPDLAVSRLLETPAFQVLGEPGLIDGAGGGQAHAGGGHGPEPRQAPGMGIGWQAAALAELAAEVGELGIAQAAFQKGSCIDAGRSVGLEMHLVPFAWLGAGVENVVQAHLHHGRGG